MKCILGKKIGMTQVFRPDGTVTPVTRVHAGPCVVTQVKTKEKDGVAAIEIGFGEKKAFRLNRAEQGHLKGLPMMSVLKSFRLEEEGTLKRGDTFTVSTFSPGDTIDVTGWAKGRGFQGVVKRHGFHGQPRTHGHKDQERMPGSLGAGGVQRVFKDMRMGGRMGNNRVTVSNLEVVEVHRETNELFIKGAVPGARGGLLLIVADAGDIQIEVKPTATEQVAEATGVGEMTPAVEAPSIPESQ